jgi:hypothetical protein
VPREVGPPPGGEVGLGGGGGWGPGPEDCCRGGYGMQGPRRGHVWGHDCIQMCNVIKIHVCLKKAVWSSVIHSFGVRQRAVAVQRSNRPHTV